MLVILKNVVRFINVRFFKTLNSYGIFGKLFWIAISCLSIWNIAYLFLLMFKRFQTDSVGISLETDYLHWANTFPAVTICLAKSGNEETQAEEFFKAHDITNKITKRFYMEQLLTTVAGNKARTCAGLPNCGITNELMDELQEIIPATCNAFMGNVTYLGQPVENCADVFKLHHISMGFCYLANNIMDYGTKSNLPLKYDISDTKRSLSFALNSDWKYHIFVHSPEEIPYFLISPTLVYLHENRRFSYKVNEVVNSPEVMEETVAQRKCKFTNEFLKDSTFHYSYSTCMTDFKIHSQLKTFNCTMRVAPVQYKKYYCDADMSRPISDYAPDKVLQLQDIGYTCYPSCVEQQITLIGAYSSNRPKFEDHTILDIEVPNIPTIRYKRIVKQSYLDLVVSVGGVIGLFIGASLINIVEILFAYGTK